MKNYLIFLLLIAFVFLAGCTALPGTQPVPPPGVSAGVVIKSFSPDFSEVRSGEPVSFSLMVENVGESEAEEIKAQLFGLNPNEWVLASGQEWTQTTDSLVAANPTAKLAGGSYEFSWSLESPKDLRVDNTYTANARVHYEYSTSAIATLHFLTYDYLRSLPTASQEIEKKTAGVSQFQQSGSVPVKVSVTAGTRPLIIYKDTEKFSIQIKIDNVGLGNPFSKDASYPPVAKEDLYKVYVKVSTSGGVPAINCPVLEGTEKEIALTQGKTKTLFCDVTVNKADVGNKIDYTMDILLEYAYFVDTSTSIKVLKVESV